MGNLEIISLNIWHMLASVLNLLILTLILKKFLFAPVKKIFAERRSQVDELYKSAEDAKSEAEREEALYREKIENADAEAESIIKKASARADRLSEEIVADANQKAAETLRKADADIAQEKKKAMNDLKNEISDISVQIAENIVKREINEDDHRELIDSFIDKI